MRRVLLFNLLCFLVLGLAPQRAKACWPCYSWGYCGGYYGCYAPAWYPCYSYYPWYACSPPVVYSARVVRGAEPASSTATLTVVAPPGATVFVNDVRVPMQAGRITFDVPNLEAGRRYSYQFRAETSLPGEVKTNRREVIFRAGEHVRVDLLQFKAPRPTPID